MSTSQELIHFFFKNVSITLRNRRKLRRFLVRLFKREGKPLESLNYIFCSDKELLKINKMYLKHNYYTDIITFDLSDQATTSADVYISTDRVRENARAFGTTYSKELLRVIFHGALHLCGYNDKTPNQKKTIRKKEDGLLIQFERFT
jgi:probable rRNA maturation factor